MRTKIFTATFLYSLIYFSGYMTASAQISSNGNTIIELHQTTPTPITVTPFTQPNVIQKKSEANVIKQSGLSFSQPYLSFGFLVPGEPILRSDTVQIKSTNKLGATLYVSQNHPLQAESYAVPDTSCDSGSCSTSQAGTWISPLTFGFGMRCENSQDCSDDFIEPNMYRALSIGRPVPVLGTDNITTATLVYKLNIPASQPPLPYTNSVTYYLVPNL